MHFPSNFPSHAAQASMLPCCARTAKGQGAGELRVEGRRARKGHPDAPHLYPSPSRASLGDFPIHPCDGPSRPHGLVPLLPRAFSLLTFAR